MSKLRRQSRHKGPLASGMMRWVLLGVVLVALAIAGKETFDSNVGVCGGRVEVPPPARLTLKAFVKGNGLEHVHATVGTLWHVHEKGQLPDCYLDKGTARERGWKPGGDLWASVTGAAIGGNRFSNREGRLPQDGNYVEADLDFAGGRRGARRLVFDRDTRGKWLMWVTMDHYKSFVRVPSVDVE